MHEKKRPELEKYDQENDIDIILIQESRMVTNSLQTAMT